MVINRGLGLLFVASTLTTLLGADWAQFRGPSATSVASSEQSLPVEWNTTDMKNVAWRADLPGRGPSGPIVVGDRVFVTASSGYHQDRLHVLAFDANSGKQLWERQYWATGRTQTHPTSANAAPTPASDGTAIYAFYSSNDLICLDLDGNLRWFRGLAHDFPLAGNDIGMASSPIVADGTVVVQVENQGDSFVAAIDTRTGVTRWQIARPKSANWASPIVATPEGSDPVVLLKSDEGLDAYDLKSGLRRWTYEAPAGGIASAVSLNNRVFLPADGLTLLQLPEGTSTTPQVEWSSNRLNASACSPVVVGDEVYVVGRAGVLVCASLKDGEVKWQLRINGSYWATPVYAGGYIYCINETGQAQVVKPGEKPEIVARNDFGQNILGSPAVAGNALYVRSDASLWKIAQAADK